MIDEKIPHLSLRRINKVNKTKIDHSNILQEKGHAPRVIFVMKVGTIVWLRI